jgi:hypothetical protein
MGYSLPPALVGIGGGPRFLENLQAPVTHIKLFRSFIMLKETTINAQKLLYFLIVT